MAPLHVATLTVQRELPKIPYLCTHTNISKTLVLCFISCSVTLAIAWLAPVVSELLANYSLRKSG